MSDFGDVWGAVIPWIVAGVAILCIGILALAFGLGWFVHG